MQMATGMRFSATDVNDRDSRPFFCVQSVFHLRLKNQLFGSRRKNRFSHG